MKKIIIILLVFFFDRITKVYLINLHETGTNVDFYISPFLNFFLVWNKGIGFGLLSLEASVLYHILSEIIILVNIVLVYFLVTLKGSRVYMISLILGGSLGNLFDRLYYYAVPDFIDLHIKSFHWFIFNIADIFITLGIIGLIFFEFMNKKESNVEKA